MFRMSSSFFDAMFSRERFLFTGGNSTRWNSYVPIKLNILFWMISLDCIPTKEDFGSRELFLILCFVHRVPETAEHVFAGCKGIDGIWPLIAKWWTFWLLILAWWICSLSGRRNILFSTATWKYFDVVIITNFWEIWNFRNAQIFGTVKPRKTCIFDDIIEGSGWGGSVGAVTTIGDGAVAEAGDGGEDGSWRGKLSWEGMACGDGVHKSQGWVAMVEDVDCIVGGMEFGGGTGE
ncbi:LOW QUALITY PROTEIN: hypothetical protein OSB04_011747 [Centaurea solstitialis]|uniref:Reverse transcriptase zinc-binding domain-containing protein n=1 Tax=Centaurea solstitialis TaxID=347529 RepID=A0AA38THL4_9ASTR|nr:LOW QUALITY PROTEIN: hypothetical protein OSB04_011747 [Centaurea solstitialis]